MKEVDKTVCWICERKELTGEHVPKHSDLKQIFEKVSQKEPLIYRDGKLKKYLGTTNTSLLKLKTICGECNNRLTQPYDNSWKVFSKYLFNLREKDNFSKINGNSIYKYDTKSALLNLHLYFVKIFGCIAIHYEIPLDLFNLAESLKTGKNNSKIFLRFGKNPSLAYIPKENAGISQVIGENDCHFKLVHFFYEIGRYIVEVNYLEISKMNTLPKNLTKAGLWHPSLGTSKIGTFKF